jgi:hypothetical protein
MGIRARSRKLRWVRATIRLVGVRGGVRESEGIANRKMVATTPLPNVGSLGEYHQQPCYQSLGNHRWYKLTKLAGHVSLYNEQYWPTLCVPLYSR